MEELKYPTKDVYEGPLLIGAEELRKLDVVIEKQWQKLMEWHTEKVEEEADRRIADSLQPSWKDLSKDAAIAKVAQEYEWRNSERHVEVQFRGDKTTSAETFEKLLSRPAVKDLLPTSFSVTLEKGPIKAEIEPSYDAYSTNGYSVEINSSTQIAYEVKEALGRWLGGVSPKWWLRWWAKATRPFPLQWALVFLLGYILLIIWGVSDSPREIALQAYHSKLQHEAAILLEDGHVAEDEVLDALRINLELATDYLPADTVVAPRRFPKVWLWALGLSVVLALLLSFRPRFGIAIGKGSVRVKAWRVWLKFVGGTLPLAVLTYLFLPWLGKWLWG